MLLNRILGQEIAFYVKAHRRLVFCSLLLTAISALFVVVPAYLLQPFVDEGMKAGADLATWKIPWVAIDFSAGFSMRRTDLVLVENVSSNRLLVLLTFVAFLSVVL